LLRSDDIRIADVAARLGYQSEAAFSRAFKRFMGMSPSTARRSPGRRLLDQVTTADPEQGDL
jgi:AraC-like DNA-binding protein